MMGSPTVFQTAPPQPQSKARITCPAVFDGGALYEWSVNHVVELEHPEEPFRRIGPRSVTRETSHAAW